MVLLVLINHPCSILLVQNSVNPRGIRLTTACELSHLGVKATTKGDIDYGTVSGFSSQNVSTMLNAALILR